ncbi:MAG: P-loop NTPase fold protein [Candidatus Omnitrophica bacterium]|jgi:hypothetical protein|nr:KAP family NTPase [Candidatus Omnitrophota bacterium]MDD5070369.1 P-loop NTPase fold protein [Candidatus Omnitrophota bacterium]
MKVKPGDFKIPAEDIFRHDKLKRDIPIKNLTAVFENTSESFVLCVDAPYGQGKTTFVELWRAYLKSKGIKSILFNAWENDYTENPLICLIAEIEASLEHELKFGSSEDRNKIRKQSKKFLEIGGKLVKAALPTMVKIVTAGSVDIKDLKEDVISEFVEKNTQTAINEYSKNRNLLNKFKNTLAENVKLISDNHRFYIFVDDLDRCRPSFAIEVLETIKHLFYIEGIVFVLTMDERQLKTCIEHVYGKQTDSSGYLKRFIDMTYLLTAPNIEAYCREMFARFDLLDYFVKREEGRNLIDSEKFNQIENDIVGLINYFKMTLREVEKIFTNFIFILKSTRNEECICSDILFLLLLIRFRSSLFYEQIIRKKITMEQILHGISEILDIPENKILKRGNEVLFFTLARLNLALNDSLSDSKWKEFYDVINKKYSNDEEIKGNIEWLMRNGERARFTFSFNNLLNAIDKKISFLEEVKI